MACKNLRLALNNNLVGNGRNEHHLARAKGFALLAIESNLRFALDTHIDCERITLAIVQFGRAVNYKHIRLKELTINEQITSSEILLIGANGEQLGIVPRAEALALADKE
ncbi:MAG: hypothetical protein IJD27_04945, partial [Alistipes sp.]|nr:hypothetical protein [Alistipes sp.]